VSKVFLPNWSGLNLPRTMLLLAVLYGLLAAAWVFGTEVDLVTLFFAALYVALSDPGGPFGSASRVWPGMR
jgi:hypothetical protein